MFPTDVIVQPPPWLYKPREIWPPRIIAIHATRSGQIGPTWDLAKEFGATVNWFESTANQARDKNGNLLGYGACASNIIGGNGELGIVLSDDLRPTWGMGFGAPGAITTWPVDYYAISYEVCQATIYTPFTDAQYNRLAFECWMRHVLYGIPMVFLPYLTQTENPVPAGITRHDNCANGKYYGKSDPGPLFDEAKLLERIDYWRRQEDDMSTEDWHDRRWSQGLLEKASGFLAAAAALCGIAWSDPEYAELAELIKRGDENLQHARQVLRDHGLGPETGNKKVDSF
jgi:hypothetical protein